MNKKINYQSPQIEIVTTNMDYGIAISETGIDNIKIENSDENWY